MKREELKPVVSQGDPELKSLQKEFKTKRKSLFSEMPSNNPGEPPAQAAGRAPSKNKYAKPVKPVRSGHKIGRNEKIDVRYTDGTVKKSIKYKFVKQDIEEGKCEIIS